MVYTSFDMIRDCRAGKSEGWAYFTAHYDPVIRRFVEHYAPGRAANLAPSFFDSIQPCAEREFVAALRQRVLSNVQAPESALALETLRDALEPLTLLEKEVVWFETMRYDAEAAARMLRMDPRTVEKIRAGLDPSIRGSLAANGLSLGRVVAAQVSPECVSAKTLLDVIDGRATWSQRQEMERHATACWHCIDHLCRLHEACDVLRNYRPKNPGPTTR